MIHACSATIRTTTDRTHSHASARVRVVRGVAGVGRSVDDAQLVVRSAGGGSGGGAGDHQSVAGHNDYAD